MKKRISPAFALSFGAAFGVIWWNLGGINTLALAWLICIHDSPDFPFIWDLYLPFLARYRIGGLIYEHLSRLFCLITLYASRCT
jgi:hypothetical protein